MNRDLHNNVDVRQVFGPVSVADNTSQSAIIDRKGYESLEFVICSGTIADAACTFTVLVEDSDVSDMTGAVAVDDSQLLGTEALASFDQTAPNTIHRLGYVGGRRFVRLTLTPAGNSSAALLGAVAILGHPAVAPTIAA